MPRTGSRLIPPPDPFVKKRPGPAVPERAFAGEHGVIAVRGDAFVHSANQEPVRFWAVNGPPAELSGPALATCARRLAKYGVNLVRMHGAVFEKVGRGWDPKRVAHVQEAVAALKAEGIYSHLSIYFPLWMTPAADHPWLKGYDGKKPTRLPR